jgi:hypothetical protein
MNADNPLQKQLPALSAFLFEIPALNFSGIYHYLKNFQIDRIEAFAQPCPSILSYWRRPGRCTDSGFRRNDQKKELCKDFIES